METTTVEGPYHPPVVADCTVVSLTMFAVVEVEIEIKVEQVMCEVEEGQYLYIVR